MHKLINTKFHCPNSVREHIMLLCDVGAKLKALKMGFDEPFSYPSCYCIFTQ
jgi:hypothetical protein